MLIIESKFESLLVTLDDSVHPVFNLVPAATFKNVDASKVPTGPWAALYLDTFFRDGSGAKRREVIF